MKVRPAFASFVFLTPCIVAGLMIVGSRHDESLGGRLLQIAGGFIGLAWSTWMFLEFGLFVTRVLGAGAPNESSEAAESVSDHDLTPVRPTQRPTRRRAA